jgi:hypothetical protein
LIQKHLNGLLYRTNNWHECHKKLFLSNQIFQGLNFIDTVLGNFPSLDFGKYTDFSTAFVTAEHHFGSEL